MLQLIIMPTILKKNSLNLPHLELEIQEELLKLQQIVLRDIVLILIQMEFIKFQGHLK